MPSKNKNGNDNVGESTAGSGYTPSLSRWNDWSELKSLIPWTVILLLLALSTYYLSRPKPEDLQKRAEKMLSDIQAQQNSSAPDSGAHALSLVLTQLREEEEADFARGLWQHISHALFVACFLILAVEIHTRRVARRDMRNHVDEVTKNVFQGVSQRLLGEHISLELREILREDFVKESAGYQLTFEGTPDGDSEWVVVREESWYDVRNLTNEQLDFPFKTSICGHHKETRNVGGVPTQFPQFVSVTIDRTPQSLSDFQDSKQPDVLKKNLPFQKNSLLSVKVITRLLYRTKDSVVFSSSIAMEKSEVTISNQVANLLGDFEVIVLHKQAGQVNPRTTGLWEFNRALLPGQGWYVSWRKANPDGSQSGLIQTKIQAAPSSQMEASEQAVKSDKSQVPVAKDQLQIDAKQERPSET